MIATDTVGVEIWVATAPVDMRKSFDGLMEVVRSFLGHDPLSGSLFVFRNRAGHMLKILWWDRDGLAIYYKKHEEDYLQWFIFTEIGGGSYNLVGWSATAG